MFFVKEMSARRNRLNGAEKKLYALYEWAAEYGGSVWKPFSRLAQATALAIILQCAVSFVQAVNSECKTSCKITWDSEKFFQISGLTLSNSFPFIPVSKEASKAEEIFKSTNQNYARASQIISFLYGLSSFLFLFLIALSLRNKFKMK